MFSRFGVPDGLVRALQRLIWVALQPHGLCQDGAGVNVEIKIEINQANRLPTCSMLERCLKLYPSAIEITDMMERNSQKRAGSCEGVRIRSGQTNGDAALCVTQSGSEIADALMKCPQQVEQLHLIEEFATFFGDRESSGQC